MEHDFGTGEVTLEMVQHTNGLTTAEADRLREKYGPNEIKDRSKKWPQVLWEQVYGDHWYPNSIPAMMWIAIIISLAIQDYPDAGVIIGLHAFNSLLSFYETLKAGDAVAALKSALAPSCNCKRDGEFKKIMARELVPGDLVLLKIGDVVPADGILLEAEGGGGSMDIDQSGLTGESLPVKKNPGDKVYSGTVVKRGEQDFVVTETGERAEMGKGVALIQSVESKGQVEVIMNKISLFLVVFALLVNILLIIVEVTNKSALILCENNKASIKRGCYTNETQRVLSNFIVLMVAAIPIATPVVVTATMALGARKMAHQNAVVTRLSAIEELAGMTVLCSDKTGTLTKNVLTIDDPKLVEGKDPDDLIFKAALAAKTVDPDAIDKCVLNSVKNRDELKRYDVLSFLPFDPIVKRTEASIRGPDGREFKTSKGAPQVILNLMANKDKLKPIVDQAVEDFAGRGLRPVAVAETDGQDNWRFLGLISLFDPPRDDTALVIEQALSLGASVKMITGDHLLIAKETCRRLGMGDSILRVDALEAPHARLLELVENVDGFAEVFPENKFDIVALYQERGHITGMTGDGVNDAPALRKANVGFAVEGATPAAQGAASVILLTPGLSVIITAIKRSRKIFQRLQNYLIYRVFMSVLLMLFFFIAIAWLHLDFPSIIIIFMCLILDLATMSLAYDKVFPSPAPNRWNLRNLIILASVMGIIAAAGNLVWLAFLHGNVAGLSKVNQGRSTACSSAGMAGMDCKSGCPEHYFPNFKTGNTNSTTYMQHWIALYPLCAVWYEDPSVNFDQTKCGQFAREATQTTGTFYTCYPNTKSSVPDTFDFSIDPWDLTNFPYSSAVINTVMFHVLCLTCNFAVFSCRVREWFYSRRPGYVLLTIIGSEAIIITIIAAVVRNYHFWNPQADESTIRLTGLNGAYIGADILFNIILFLILELAKRGCYLAMDLASYRRLAAEKKRHQMEDIRRRMTVSNARRNTISASIRANTAESRQRKSVHGPSGGHGERKATWDKKGKDNLQTPLLAEGLGAGDSEL